MKVKLMSSLKKTPFCSNWTIKIYVRYMNCIVMLNVNYIPAAVSHRMSPRGREGAHWRACCRRRRRWSPSAAGGGGGTARSGARASSRAGPPCSCGSASRAASRSRSATRSPLRRNVMDIVSSFSFYDQLTHATSFTSPFLLYYFYFLFFFIYLFIYFFLIIFIWFFFSGSACMHLNLRM